MGDSAIEDDRDGTEPYPADHDGDPEEGDSCRLGGKGGTGSEPAQPSVGDRYAILLYATQVSERSPFHMRGHPVTLATRVFDHLGIAYDATSAADTITTLGPDLLAEYRLTRTDKAAAFLERELAQPEIEISLSRGELVLRLLRNANSR